MQIDSPFGEYSFTVPADVLATWQSWDALFPRLANEPELHGEVCNLLQVILDEIDPQAETAMWCEIAHELGMSWVKRIDGDPFTNTVQGLRLYKSAMDHIDSDLWPCTWALYASSMGSSFRNLAEYAGSEHLERAMSCYQAADERVSAELEPDLKATILSNLGIAYATKEAGSHPENLERAISHFSEAIGLVGDETDPRTIAIRRNLLEAYADLAELGAADKETLRSVEQSLHSLLSAIDPKQTPTGWGECALHLARFLQERSPSQSEKRTREALALYKRVKRILFEHIAVGRQVLILTEIGRTEIALSQFDGPSQLNAGMSSLASARDLCNTLTDSSEKAGALYELGEAYRHLPRGSVLENLGNAISSLMSALDVATRCRIKDVVASISHSLANAILELPAVNRTLMLRQALSHLDRALDVVTASDQPVTRAQLLGSKAEVLARLDGERTVSDVEVLGCLQEACHLYHECGLERQYAHSLAELGRLRLMIMGEEGAHQALADLQESEQLLSGDGQVANLADVHHGLARAYLALRPAPFSQHANLARRYLETALGGYLDKNEHERAALVIRDLARLHAHERNWTKASAQYTSHRNILARAMASYLIPGHRSITRFNAGEILREGGYCAAKAGEEDAVWLLERSQTNVLRQMEASGHATVVIALSAESDFRQATLWPDDFEIADPIGRAADRLGVARSRLAKLGEEIAAAISEPLSSPVVSGSPIVNLADTVFGGIALIQKVTEDHTDWETIWLDELASANVSSWLYDQEDALGFLHCSVEGDVDSLANCLTPTWEAFARA